MLKPLRTSQDVHQEHDYYKELTVDEATTAIGVGKFQYKILMVTGLLWSADAVEVMILTFLLPILKDEWNLNDGEDGLIGTLVFGGWLIGAVLFANIGDRYGRKYGILISNGGQIIFGMLSATSQEMYTMMIFRFLTGLCLGGNSCAFTLYAEYAPKDERGKLLILQQSFWAFGALFNSLLAWLILTLLNWRWYLIISSFPLCIILYLSYKLPESVRWLVTVGRINEAENILNNAKELNNNNNNNIKYIKLIPDQIILFEKRGNLMEIFNLKHYKTTIILYNLMFVITFSYYGISFLSERFFDKIAGENDEKYWKVAITTSSEIPGIIIGMLTLDYFGRKNSMIIYFIMFIISMFCLMDKNIQNNEYSGIIFVFLGRMSSSIAFFVLYVYFCEYYPTQIRNTSIGIANAISRIAGMITTFITQSNINITYSFYLMGLSGIIGCICSILLEKDTTGTDLSHS